MAIFLIPLFGFSSCYSQWLEDLYQAARQYNEDISYCNKRGLDSMSARCYGFADYDLQTNINQAAAKYYNCLGYR